MLPLEGQEMICRFNETVHAYVHAALDVTAKREAIAALCKRYGVARLDLFGSATTESFKPQHSDLDFLVEFDSDSKHLFDRYFSAKEALESLFGRKVDLVSSGALKNPHFISAVEQARQTLYAAEDAQAA